MNKHLLLTALAATLVVFPSCKKTENNSTVMNPNPNPYRPIGTVNGVLRDRISLKPISGATIVIYDQTATTGADGQFTIKNIPASSSSGNEPGNDLGYDTYPVVIDLKSVSGGYPQVAYSEVKIKYDSLGDGGGTGNNGSGNNHDTPTDGFVASIMCEVGKLDANVKVQVAKNVDYAPLQGVSVELHAITSNNSGSGANSNLVLATATTDANGFVTFSNIEAGQTFQVKGYTADNIWKGTINVTAPADLLTETYLVQQGSSDHRGLILATTDNVAPFITGTVPADQANIAASPTGQAFEFTFSEPIQQNAYAKVLTPEQVGPAGGVGLWKDITVTQTSLQGGSISVPFTLSWDSTFTKLTVTVPATIAPAQYVVNIAGAMAANKLMDASNNPASIGASSGRYAVKVSTSATLPTLTAPAIALDAVNPYKITWGAVTNAFGYMVRIDRYRGGILDGTYTTPSNALVTNTYFDLLDGSVGNNAFNSNFWFNNTIPYTYKVSVFAVPYTGNLNAGVQSNVLTLDPTAFTPGKPVVTKDANIPTRVSWSSTGYAYNYEVTIERFRAGVFDSSYVVPSYINTGNIDVSSYFAIYSGWFTGMVPYTYNVKVRAIDRTGTLSTYSDPVQLTNPVTTPVAPVLVVDNSSALPNPTRITWATDPNAKQFLAVVRRFKGGVYDSSNVATPYAIPSVTNTVLDIANGNPTGQWAGWVSADNQAYTYTVQIFALGQAGLPYNAGVASNTLALSGPAIAKPGAPVLVRHDITAELPADKPARSQWVHWDSLTPAAKGYQIVTNRFRAGVFEATSTLTNPGSILWDSTTFGTFDIANSGVWTGWWSADAIPVPYTYTIQLIALDGTGNPLTGTTSNLLSLGDIIPPKLSSVVSTPGWEPAFGNYVGSQLIPGPANQKTTYKLDLSFDRPLSQADLLNKANWSITHASAAYTGGPYLAGANDFDPVVTGVAFTYPGNTTAVTLSLAVTQDGTSSRTWDPRNLVIAFTGKDVSGVNALDANQNTWTMNNGVLAVPTIVSASVRPESNPTNLLDASLNKPWSGFLDGSQVGPIQTIPGTATPILGGTSTYRLYFTFNGDINTNPAPFLTLAKCDDLNGGAPAVQATDVNPTITTTAWDPATRTLRVDVSFTQNGTNTATWDPKKWVFKFRGVTDSLGNPLDANYANYSLSKGGFFKWTQQPTVTKVTSSSNPISRGVGVYNAPVRFTIEVDTSTTQTGTPTGQVTLYDGGTQIGTSPYTPNTPINILYGNAAALGTHNIWAKFVPTGQDYTGSQSTVLAQVVNQVAYQWTSPVSYSIAAGAIAANDPTPTLNRTSPAPSVVSFGVSPALPTGLSLNATTGRISGTPTVASPATNYTITTTLSTGEVVTSTVTITVTP